MKTKTPLFAAIAVVALLSISCTATDNVGPKASAIISHTCAPWDGAAFMMSVKKSPNTLTPIEMTIWGALPAEGNKATFKMDGVSDRDHGKFADKKPGKVTISVAKGSISGVVKMNGRPDVEFDAKIDPKAAASFCGGVVRQTPAEVEKQEKVVEKEVAKSETVLVVETKATKK